jgi:hypothetical protein
MLKLLNIKQLLHILYHILIKELLIFYTNLYMDFLAINTFYHQNIIRYELKRILILLNLFHFGLYHPIFILIKYIDLF